MSEYTQSITQHYGPTDISARIVERLQNAGKNLGALSRDDLAPFDEFHGGGRESTRALARFAHVQPGMEVLDVGSGVGGPARTLAAEFGCRVMGIDLTEAFCQAAQMLTERVGLSAEVQFRQGNALDMPFEDVAFDMVWSQNTLMNIDDKARLFREVHRVLRPGGVFAFQTFLTGDGSELHYPTLWADSPALNFLVTPEETKTLLAEAGLHERLWEDTTARSVMGARRRLDEVAPHNPVCVMDLSCHACYANSAALALAGIDRYTPDPPHGQIRRDTHDESNGALWERAMNVVHALSLRAYLDHYGDAVADLVHANGLRHLACGITSVGDALVTPEAAEMYRLAETQKKLPFVLHQMLGGRHFYTPPEDVATGAVNDGQVSDRLRGGTVKIFMDPVFPDIALIRYPACGEVEYLGKPNYTQDEVNHLVLRAHQHGLQVAIHCLGTWAVEQALNAFEYTQNIHARAEPRFRIEYFSLPSASQIQRAQSLGVVACVQPPFVFTNGDRYAQRAQAMGGGLRGFPFQTMLSAGMMVAATSDSPCAPGEPLLGLYAAVTRQTRSGGPPVAPEEAIAPLDGLRMYTINAAYAMGRESEVGSLEPGKRADLVVLSHAPTVVDPAFMRDVTVEQTYVEGKCLYQR